MQADECSCGYPSQINLIGVHAPRIAILFHRFSKKTNSSFSVVISAPHGTHQCIRDIQEVIHANTVRHRSNDIPHLGQVFAKRHNILTGIVTANEESPMPHNDQRPTLVHITFRFVDVNDKALVQSGRVDGTPVFDVIRDVEIFECGHVAIACTVAFVNLSEGCIWRQQTGAASGDGHSAKGRVEFFHL